jgi:hypothetical protein
MKIKDKILEFLYFLCAFSGRGYTIKDWKIKWSVAVGLGQTKFI